MSCLDFVKAYLNDLLVMMSDTLDDPLRKLTLVLDQLWTNGLKVKTDKNMLCAMKLKYLDYWITQDGI
eukprot:5136838-Ditylum_brightwellii.AAC.1